METGDLVATWSDAGGVPRRFQWRGRIWVVAGHPVPWTNRAPWWGSATISGTVTSAVQQMWRLVAADPFSGETTTLDLGVEEPGWCRVASVVD